MSYQHDVFISYRRELLWTPWTRDHFKTLLTAYLQQELGAPPDIFVDERIVVGADWVDELGSHLAGSKAVVAILSRDYFGSPWCVHELDLILDRNGGQPGLFIPVIVHDCDRLPDPVGRAQPANLKDYRITHMAKDSPTYEHFSAAVGTLAPMVSKIIGAAPVFNSAWLHTCKARFNDVYNAVQARSTVPPSHFSLPLLAPLIPPRLVL